MRLALLCPGPSLAGCDYQPDRHDLTLGVNRAALWATVDWWVFMDWRVFLDYRPPYRVNVCTTRGARNSIDRKGRGDDLRAGELRIVEDMRDQYPHATCGNWTTYSATTALVFAGVLGADTVDVYGADMAGVEDYDGHTSEHDTRTDKRWNREGVIWRQAVAALNERGVEVIRHGPA